LLISVDIGYGFTKSVTDSGHRISFPSVVAPAHVDLFNGIFDNSIGHKVNMYMLGNSQEKFIGDLALNSTAAQNFVARHEKPADIHDLLLLSAVYLCVAGSFSEVNKQEIDLVVGLPLSFYRGQKDALKDRLLKLSAWVSVDGKERKYISFNKVMVFPQGAGALVSLGDTLPDSGMIGLIDIGTYTTDFMLFEIKNGMPVPMPDACGSVEAGIYLAQRSLAEEFEKQVGSPLPQRMYQKAMELARDGKSISFEGRNIDLLPAWKQAQKEIAETIAGHVLALWGDRAGFLDTTVFAGGGSIWFGNILENAFSNTMYAQDGVFANAVGYLKMATGTQKP
jgi:plasmid segregation protein ParM